MGYILCFLPSRDSMFCQALARIVIAKNAELKMMPMPPIIKLFLLRLNKSSLAL
jgi:hypothetical protein